MVKRPDYFSYLLRLWQAGTGQEAIWRASLEQIPTGERRAFASLDSLVAYLRERTGTGSSEEANAGEQDMPDDGAVPLGGEEV